MNVQQVAVIRAGYLRGWFPMGNGDGEVHWYEPAERALLPIAGMYVSKSLRRKLHKTSVQWVGAPKVAEQEFDVRFDTAFEATMRGCLRPTGNWITEDLIEEFVGLAELGWAHSVEVWKGNDLVGGLYGVHFGVCFHAESMFHRVTDASKIALWAAIEQTRRLGFTIFDAQLMNPHLASLGAYPMPQRRFLELMRGTARDEPVWR